MARGRGMAAHSAALRATIPSACRRLFSRTCSNIRRPRAWLSIPRAQASGRARLTPQASWLFLPLQRVHFMGFDPHPVTVQLEYQATL